MGSVQELHRDRGGKNEMKAGKKPGKASGRRLSAGPRDDLVLSLAELAPDVANEIVIESDVADLRIALLTNASVVESGIVTSHLTASGDDVSGCRFLLLSTGLTLFLRQSVSVELKPYL